MTEVNPRSGLMGEEGGVVRLFVCISPNEMGIRFVRWYNKTLVLLMPNNLLLSTFGRGIMVLG